MLRERQQQRQSGENPVPTDNGKIGLVLSGLIWAGLAVFFVWSFYSGQSVGTRLFSAFSLIWSGLWTRFLAIDHGRPRLGELCLLSSFVAFIGMLVTAATQLGLPLDLPAGIFTMISAALLVSVINRSKLALMVAIGGGLVWAGLQFDGLLQSGSFGMAIPALWAGMMLQAVRLKTHMGLLTCVVTAYIWLIGSAMGSLQNGGLSGLYLVAGAAVIGTMHYRASKAAEDEGFKGTSLHVTAGWLIANGALLCLANYSFDPAAAVWSGSQDVAQIHKLAWAAIMALALFCMFIAGLIRRKHKRMSLAGVAMTTLLPALIPVFLWYESSAAGIFQQITDIELYPTAGLFLFGIVTGNIFFFVANSFRRWNFVQVGAGILAAGALAIASQNVDIIFGDNWVTWLFGFAASVLVTLIALEPQLEKLSASEPRRSVSSS